MNTHSVEGDPVAWAESYCFETDLVTKKVLEELGRLVPIETIGPDYIDSVRETITGLIVELQSGEPDPVAARLAMYRAIGDIESSIRIRVSPVYTRRMTNSPLKVSYEIKVVGLCRLAPRQHRIFSKDFDLPTYVPEYQPLANLGLRRHQALLDDCLAEAEDLPPVVGRIIGDLLDITYSQYPPTLFGLNPYIDLDWLCSVRDDIVYHIEEFGPIVSDVTIRMENAQFTGSNDGGRFNYTLYIIPEDKTKAQNLWLPDVVLDRVGA